MCPAPLPWPVDLAPLSAAGLKRYMTFIGARVELPTIEALARLVRAHLLAIPFENLSPLLGEPVPLDEAALCDKLLGGQRGGYCFEHNVLLAQAVAAVGFDVHLRAARFVLRSPVPRPRTHLVVVARCDGRDWLLDVGFGRNAMFGPVDLAVAEPQRPEQHLGVAAAAALGPQRAVRVVDVGSWSQLELEDREQGWEEQYLIDPSPVYMVDVDQFNAWVSTAPESHVRQLVIVRRPVPGGSRSLMGAELNISEPGRRERRLIDAGELGDVLRDEFGITLPAPVYALDRRS